MMLRFIPEYQAATQPLRSSRLPGSGTVSLRGLQPMFETIKR